MKYNLFGTTTGLYASEIILGAASFGTRSGYGTEPENAKEILTAYADAGGNFIDTSDAYQLGQSEEIVGEFIKDQRSNFIICTKYTRSSEANASISNFGNHRKAMRQGIESSLKRLKTDYIDIYMPHYDDGITPIDEITRGLEDLVSSGKVLYTGLTNFPAWKASAIASSIKLSAIQIEYNLLQRTADREFIAMAKHFGLGTMMYSPLAGGQLTGKYRKGETGRINRNSNEDYQENETVEKIINELFVIAAELEVTAGQVALAWVLSKGGFPLIGARSIDNFNDALKSTPIKLSDDHIQKLNRLSAISLGYPHDLLKNVRGF
ncbi:aryl-alcohol dehydrogenase-like predicted oxidoreductase [Chryseobacterium ginsenosidimutans]|uniref:aldo/keto reductase n=1 Tax=Chryseobacterium ginsenosidimutans TaxID=687846 RepID=UPI002169CCEA|nr:aldo/keto reductase [Chryseobacterium ginsenosidimutans]MCS3869509.1 aryl-alcohol dehydrogenase-like predicted oxidoreductase [Chryseobacterium ginsenosidimutans]